METSRCPIRVAFGCVTVRQPQMSNYRLCEIFKLIFPTYPPAKAAVTWGMGLPTCYAFDQGYWHWCYSLSPSLSPSLLFSLFLWTDKSLKCAKLVFKIQKIKSGTHPETHSIISLSQLYSLLVPHPSVSTPVSSGPHLLMSWQSSSMVPTVFKWVVVCSRWWCL